MNRITLPGLIDLHVHLRTPGQSEKEDFYTGTSAALAGGFTTVVDMPNNKIPITTQKLLEEKQTIALKQTVCDIGFYFGSVGNNTEEFEAVKSHVLGLKLYLNETTGNFLISKEAIEDVFKKWPKQKPILLHAEGDAVSFVINLSQKYGNKIHICHIARIEELEEVMRAKEKGIQVTCGVTPHHLFLTENDQEKLGPLGLMKPPLQSKQTVQFLWDHLSSIDCVESDHAPHTRQEKEASTPLYGVPGLETTLPLLLTAVSENKLNLDDIKRLCYEGPKKILSLTHDTGSIDVDLDEEWTIQGENLQTKCHWTPFEGKKVTGRVKKIVLSGKTVFENGKILAEKGSGEIIE